MISPCCLRTTSLLPTGTGRLLPVVVGKPPPLLFTTAGKVFPLFVVAGRVLLLFTTAGKVLPLLTTAGKVLPLLTTAGKVLPLLTTAGRVFRRIKHSQK